MRALCALTVATNLGSDRTRVPVSVALGNLADGQTPEPMHHQSPSLKPEHFPAALAHASDLTRERIVPMPA